MELGTRSHISGLEIKQCTGFQGLDVSCSCMALGTTGNISGCELKQILSGRVWCWALGFRSVVRVCASSLV